MTQALIRSGVLLAVMAACGQPEWVAPDQQCPGELRPVWTANPNYSMCVVTSFQTRDLRTWTRGNAGNPRDVLTVQADVAQTQIDLTGGWPPRLTASDAVRAERAISRIDSSAGIISQTELRTRADGDATTPLTFVSGIRAADGRYMLASGQAANAATLDTLLMMFRTVRRTQAPDPNLR